MPQIVGGKNITDSAQINTGVVTADDIATDAVDTAEIKSQAVDTDEIKQGAILNEDINSAAGIVDTKLAQITTASKVHGSSLTGLASIPAGAGKIPAANLGGAINIIPATSVDNDANVTTIATIPIGAGELGTANVMYFKIPVWKVKKATSASNAYIDCFYDDDRIAYVDVTNNAATFTDYAGYIEGWLWATGATNTQRGLIRSFFSTDNTSNNTVTAFNAEGTDVGAKDSTGALNLYIKWKNGDASVNDYIYTGPGFYTLISA